MAIRNHLIRMTLTFLVGKAVWMLVAGGWARTCCANMNGVHVSDLMSGQKGLRVNNYTRTV